MKASSDSFFTQAVIPQIPQEESKDVKIEVQEVVQELPSTFNINVDLENAAPISKTVDHSPELKAPKKTSRTR